MTTIALYAHTDIPHPAATVFAHVADLCRKPRWHDAMQQVTPLKPGSPGTGSAWSINLQLLGAAYTTTVTLTAFDPERSLTFAGTPIGPATPQIVFTLLPRGDITRLDIHVTVDVAGKVRGPVRLLASQLGKQALRGYLGRLKAALG